MLNSVVEIIQVAQGEESRDAGVGVKPEGEPCREGLVGGQRRVGW